MRLPAVLVVGALVASAQAAQAPESTLPAGLDGLLTPPPAAVAASSCSLPDPARVYALFVAPLPGAASAGALRFAAPEGSDVCEMPSPLFESPAGAIEPLLPQVESSYEDVAVPVLERRGSWHRIGIPGSSAWLDSDGTGLRYDDYPELLVERLSYTLPAWNGLLCQQPNKDCKRIARGEEDPVTVLATTQQGDSHWLHVEFRNDGCSGESTAVRATGWIRAYGDDGQVAAWFHSRGC